MGEDVPKNYMGLMVPLDLVDRSASTQYSVGPRAMHDFAYVAAASSSSPNNFDIR